MLVTSDFILVSAFILAAIVFIVVFVSQILETKLIDKIDERTKEIKNELGNSRKEIAFEDFPIQDKCFDDFNWSDKTIINIETLPDQNKFRVHFYINK